MYFPTHLKLSHEHLAHLKRGGNIKIHREHLGRGGIPLEITATQRRRLEKVGRGEAGHMKFKMTEAQFKRNAKHHHHFKEHMRGGRLYNNEVYNTGNERKYTNRLYNDEVYNTGYQRGDDNTLFNNEVYNTGYQRRAPSKKHHSKKHHADVITEPVVSEGAGRRRRSRRSRHSKHHMHHEYMEGSGIIDEIKHYGRKAVDTAIPALVNAGIKRITGTGRRRKSKASKKHHSKKHHSMKHLYEHAMLLGDGRRKRHTKRHSKKHMLEGGAEFGAHLHDVYTEGLKRLPHDIYHAVKKKVTGGRKRKTRRSSKRGGNVTFVGGNVMPLGRY